MTEMKRIILFMAALLFATASLWARQGLSHTESVETMKRVVAEWMQQERQRLAPILSRRDSMAVSSSRATMPFWYTIYGQAPWGERSLWISLHGGGGTTQEINNGQWDNQKRLYQPEEGVYVAPRAPWNAWDMWCQEPIDELYEQLIRLMVCREGVHPDKVYLMGYSAGGDGVWREAPRMADHWAAASMMAGHPGDVSLVNLRNTPFMIWCGANDAAYNRNRVNTQRGIEMDSLQQTDPTGFIHETHILPGKPHWMDLEDKAALPWMAQYRRNPYPSTVIWVQGDRGHKHFYWLGVPEEETKKGAQLRVSVKGNAITIDSDDYTSVTLFLNDDIVNLNRSITVKWGKRTVFKGRLPRTQENLRNTINLRGDLAYCFPSQVTVKKTAKTAALVSTHI
jgi:poly(3-hydroxybutyrate) depolymerase